MLIFLYTNTGIVGSAPCVFMNMIYPFEPYVEKPVVCPKDDDAGNSDHTW
jgi:hypothetical protein